MTARLLLLLFSAGLAGCTAASAPRAPAPPVTLAGTWLVDGVYDSGTHLPTTQERQALAHQAMRVTDDRIVDPLGRECDDPVYEIRGTTAADWFGFGHDWLGRRGADVPLTAVTVHCDGAAFDGYALREDGALVGRYKDAYMVLRREDDPRVSDRLSALAPEPRRPLAPQAASLAPVVIGSPEDAAPGSADTTRTVSPAPAPATVQALASAPASATPGEALLHLASLRSQEAAEQEWAAIRRRAPVLGDWTVRYRSVDLPEKGRFVRVFVVPPAGVSPQTACARVEQAGQYCRVL